MKPIPKYIALLLIIIGFYACASTGQPDGGPYDETPPKFVRATPEPNATNNKRKKISIEFDEYIKLDKPSEKVIISPPQKEAPEVKVSGHRVLVEFFDTLQENTTYTVDFGDAIVDNNEDNPLGNFAYAFSTGEHIDTMEVSGTVLNAQDLEPIKGIQVGLHKDLNDTAFTKLPFARISRTDSRGHFTIRGVAPGKYRIYALQDGNQNYLFDSKTEAIAWQDSLVIPSMAPAVRQDTVWNELDTLAYDTIYEVKYTRFMPDDLILRAFKEENPMQYLVKSEREQLNRFSLYFSAKANRKQRTPRYHPILDKGYDALRTRHADLPDGLSCHRHPGKTGSQDRYLADDEQNQQGAPPGNGGRRAEERRERTEKKGKARRYHQGRAQVLCHDGRCSF